MKKGDKVWFTDWRGARHAGVIANCDSQNGKPVFDISVHNEPITFLQTRRGPLPCFHAELAAQCRAA